MDIHFLSREKNIQKNILEKYFLLLYNNNQTEPYAGLILITNKLNHMLP